MKARYFTVYVFALLSFASRAEVSTSLSRALDQPNPSYTTPVHFVVVFGKNVTGFDASDISFAGSTVEGNLVAVVTGGPFRFDINVKGMIPSGTLKLTIPQHAAENPEDIEPTQAATISIGIAGASPTVTINQAVGQADPAKYARVSFDVKFGVPVRDFDPSDVSLAGSTAGGTLTVVVSDSHVEVRGMTSSGIIKASIRAGAGVSLEGYTSIASTSTDNTVTFEWTPPPTVTVNQIPSQPDPTTLAVVRYQAAFSVPIVEFDSTDISLAGTTAQGKTSIEVSGGPQIFDIAVFNLFRTSGNVVVSIPAGAAKSSYTGNPSVASTSTDNVVRFNTLPPTPRVGSMSPDPIDRAPIHFFADFYYDVTGFTASDISFAGSTVSGNLTATVTQLESPRYYDIVVSGMTSPGTIVVSIPAGAASDSEGKLSRASTPDPTPGWDNIVTYSPPATIPTVTINKAASQPDPTGASPVRFTSIFSEVVTGFNASDLVFTGSTVAGNLVGVITVINDRQYEVSVSGMTSPGNLVVSIRAGAAYNTAGQYNTVSTSTDNIVQVTSAATATTDKRRKINERVVE